jgi:hypothetical protein
MPRYLDQAEMTSEAPRTTDQADTAADALAWTVIDVLLLGFAACTVAYEIVLIARLPACSWYGLFLAISAGAAAAQLRFGRPIRLKGFDRWTLLLVSISIVCSSIHLCTLRPDPDDFSYFHRAVYTLLDLSKPFALHHTAHDLGSLPPISPVHLTSSMEMVSALIARALGIGPLLIYQFVAGILALFAFPLVMFVVFRYLGFQNGLALTGTMLVVFLYAVSGDSHRDWGNFTLLRAWQGKCILVMLLVPLTALLSFRFLNAGSKTDLLRLQLVSISAIGLSGTAFFLMPFIMVIAGLISAGYLGRNTTFLRRTAFLAGTIVWFAMLVLVIWAGLLPNVIDTSVWTFPATKMRRPEWAILETTVFVQKTTVLFYAVAILGIFRLSEPGSTNRMFAAFSALTVFVLTVPPISSFLLQLSLYEGYWRFAYVTLMPVFIALFAVLCFQEARRSSIGRKILYFSLAVVFITAYGLMKAPAVNRSVIHSPQMVKLHEGEIMVANYVRDRAPAYAVALVPEELVNGIGLFRPDLRLVCTRPLETLHVFTNSGGRAEGRRRLTGQQELHSCGNGGIIKEIRHEVGKLSLLIFPGECDKANILSNIGETDTGWDITLVQGYQVWFKRAH